jgi:hypothetical protein
MLVIRSLSQIAQEVLGTIEQACRWPGMARNIIRQLVQEHPRDMQSSVRVQRQFGERNLKYLNLAEWSRISTRIIAVSSKRNN